MSAQGVFTVPLRIIIAQPRQLTFRVYRNVLASTVINMRKPYCQKPKRRTQERPETERILLTVSHTRPSNRWAFDTLYHAVTDRADT